jgi:tRNA threonylcarbamoyladenosine biosynthesis protein TsaB
MKLFIDTSDRQKIIVGVDGKEYREAATDGTSQKLLPLIEKALKGRRKSFTDIKEIKVVTGPGSFTGLRVGVAVANTLGWALGVTVNGKNLRKGEVVDIRYE